MMLSINKPGIFLDENLLINYRKYNLSAEELMFLLQINYITSQENGNFSITTLSEKLNEDSSRISAKIEVLVRKKIISTFNNKLTILLDNKILGEDYYTVKELFKVVESAVAKTLTSKEVDIVYSWIEKKITKKEIDEAFSISRNISYVNGILNNKVVKVEKNNIESDDVLGYDWLNK